jgi:mono/diheme cytochrome c family protein
MEVSMPRIPAPRALTLAVLLVAGAPAHAEAPSDIAKTYENAARQAAPGFAGFSAARGKSFFQSTHGADWSCASCHTDDPRSPGRHAKTGKTIAPLAPAANAERFTSLSQAEKWFRRNCNDVLQRACTDQEKGDVLAYLMQLPGAIR